MDQIIDFSEYLSHHCHYEATQKEKAERKSVESTTTTTVGNIEDKRHPRLLCKYISPRDIASYIVNSFLM